MHIGIVGPCQSGPLAEYLPGYGGIDIGWGGYSVVELVRALMERGHHVSVITLSSDVVEPIALRGPKLDYYVYPTRTKRKMRDLYKPEREWLKKGIYEAKPDILHAQWTYEFALACLETPFPTIVTIRDNAFQVLRFSKDLYRLGRLCIQLHVLRKARVLTAVSPYVANSLRSIAKAEIKVVPNFVHISRTVDGEGKRSFGPAKLATVINGWQPLKNPKMAIRAFSLLREKKPDVRLFMYGKDFQENGPASDWAVKKKLAQNIHFCGPLPREQLLEKLRNMSILLHPSLEEACPMAIVEGMALGLPIVAGTDSEAVRWVLDGGRAGFLTDTRNPKKIAQALLSACDQHSEREQKRQNAYERMRAVFSPEAVIGEYEALYEKVLVSWLGNPMANSFLSNCHTGEGR